MFKIVKKSTLDSLKQELEHEKKLRALGLEEVKKRDHEIKTLVTNLETCTERKIDLKRSLEGIGEQLSNSNVKIAELTEERKKQAITIDEQKSKLLQQNADLSRCKRQKMAIEANKNGLARLNNASARMVVQMQELMSEAMASLKNVSRGRHSVKTAAAIGLLEKAYNLPSTFNSAVFEAVEVADEQEKEVPNEPESQKD